MRGLPRLDIARGLAAAGGAVLILSLFLTWSHQLTQALIVRFGNSPLLQGVPSDPTGWQVYSIADVVLAVLAAALIAAAVGGGRGARIAGAGAALVALAFVIHAITSPPSNGVEALLAPARAGVRYTAVTPAAGPGETVAVVGLLLAIAGLALSPRRSPVAAEQAP